MPLSNHSSVMARFSDADGNWNGLHVTDVFGDEEVHIPLTLTEGYIPFNITCGTLLGYQVLLAFTGAIGIAGVALLCSAVCRNPLTAMAATGAVHILPILLPVAESSPLFRLLALTPLYQVQFVSLMSVEQMKGGMLYAGLALPVSAALAAIGFFSSRKIFSNHQIT